MPSLLRQFLVFSFIAYIISTRHKISMVCSASSPRFEIEADPHQISSNSQPEKLKPNNYKFDANSSAAEQLKVSRSPSQNTFPEEFFGSTTGVDISSELLMDRCSCTTGKTSNEPPIRTNGMVTPVTRGSGLILTTADTGDPGIKEDRSPKPLEHKPIKNYDYLWDKEEVLAIDFQQSFCSKRCLNGRKTDLHYNKTEIKRVRCFPCDCERPRCEVYGTCCPEASNPYYNLQLVHRPHLFNSTSNVESEEITISAFRDDNEKNASAQEAVSITSVGDGSNSTHELFCDTQSSNNVSYLVIRSCPHVSYGTETQRLCEERISPDEMTRKAFVRVADTSSNVIYYNDYCAKCNQVKEVVPWDLKIECNSYLSVYKALDEDEFLRLSLRNESECKVRFSPPSDISWKLKECTEDILWYRNPIGRCNIIGQWKDYDADIKDSCHALEDRMIYRVMVDQKLFKNAFCVKCNSLSLVDITGMPPTNDRTNEIYIKGPTFTDRGVLAPFSLLLGFGDRTGSSSSAPHGNVICPMNKWIGPDNNCHPLMCSEGKSLQEGKCISNLEEIRGLPYFMNVVFTVVENHTILNALQHEMEVIVDRKILQETVFETTSNDIMKILDPLVSLSEFNLSMAYNISDTEMRNKEPAGITLGAILTSLQFVHVSASLEGRMEMKRDDFESELLTKILGSTLSLELFPGETVTFQPNVLERSLQDNTRSTCDFLTRSGYGKRSSVCSTQTYSGKQTQRNSFNDNQDHFLFVHTQLSCPYAVMNKSEVLIEEEESEFPWQRRIFINFTGIRVEISESSELNQVRDNGNDSILMCRQLLKKFTARGREATFDLMNYIKYIETIVCFAISTIGLFLTLTTYCIFPLLRCAAGINNMFLCGSLMLAQIFLTAAPYISTENVLCRATGILVHFSWLWMFSWSFLCCFHMLRVFTAPTRQPQRAPSSKTFILKRFLVSLLMPASVVSVVIITTLTTSGWQRIGYGQSACFLDVSNMLAMIVPLVAVTLCDLTLFGVVVFKVWRVRSLQGSDFINTNKKQNFLIYVKLSTLTGMFWLLLLLSEILVNDILGMIAILLNGCQGLFICLSFTCNRRVSKLYMEKLQRKSPHKASMTGRTQSKQIPVYTSEAVPMT